MEHQKLFGLRRPLKRRRRSPRRYAMEKAFDRGGIGGGLRPRPLRNPTRCTPDVENGLRNPKFASRGDVQMDTAGMGKKMRPRPYRPKMRTKRRKMFFGRPMEKRGVMRRRRRYSNFVGGGKGMTNTLLIVGGAVALLCFTPLGKMVGLKK